MTMSFSSINTQLDIRKSCRFPRKIENIVLIKHLKSRLLLIQPDHRPQAAHGKPLLSSSSSSSATQSGGSGSSDSLMDDDSAVGTATKALSSPSPDASGGDETVRGLLLTKNQVPGRAGEKQTAPDRRNSNYRLEMNFATRISKTFLLSLETSGTYCCSISIYLFSPGIFCFRRRIRCLRGAACRDSTARATSRDGRRADFFAADFCMCCILLSLSDCILPLDLISVLFIMFEFSI